MAIMITFTPREHKKLISAWQQYQDQFRRTFEPSYRIGRQYLSTTEDGKPLLLTSWINGKPIIMPPADVVSIILYDPDRQTLLTYLISQPELFEHLGWLLRVDTFPTPHFQIDALDENIRQTIVERATFVSETPLGLEDSAPMPAGFPAGTPHLA